MGEDLIETLRRHIGESLEGLMAYRHFFDEVPSPDPHQIALLFSTETVVIEIAHMGGSGQATRFFLRLAPARERVYMDYLGFADWDISGTADIIQAFRGGVLRAVDLAELPYREGSDLSAGERLRLDFGRLGAIDLTAVDDVLTVERETPS